MATPKYSQTKLDRHGRMITNMNIWLSETDLANIHRIASAHGLSKAAAVRLALCTLAERMDREESTPLLPAVGS